MPRAPSGHCYYQGSRKGLRKVCSVARPWLTMHEACNPRLLQPCRPGTVMGADQRVSWL